MIEPPNDQGKPHGGNTEKSMSDQTASTEATDVENREPSRVGLTVLLGCDCQSFARTGREHGLFLKHHPNCSRYSPEADCRELIVELIRGIESWANDEDGVHWNCWSAYVAACHAVGDAVIMRECE